MHAAKNGFVTILLGLAITAMAVSSAQSQTPQASTDAPTFKNPPKGKWMPVPQEVFPKGAEMQVLNGDPARGPADFYFRVPSNYTFPWHFHTPIEKLFIDEGSLRYETRGGDTQTLRAGDYVYVPARSPHKVTCTSAGECSFFLSSSGPFDIHLVDENWKTTKSWRPEGAVGTTGR